MNPAVIQAVDHVHLSGPRALRDAFRWFYGELLGLEEAAPVDLDGRALLFHSGKIRIVLALDDPSEVDPIPLRATFLVRSLRAVQEMLNERGIAYGTVTGLYWTDRGLFVNDPAGHRMLIRQNGSIFGL